MVFKEIVNGIQIFFMTAGLLIILPPIFIYKFVRFLRQ